MEKIRLNKYLAQCGVCSRRDADKIIGAGRVSVNGVTADMGVRVDGHDSVLLDGKELRAKEEKVVLAYYKPKGVTCTEKDRFAERIVTEEINYPVRVTYAGRLDKDSEGLLLLSNDGDLIQHMMKGSEGHEKEYVVRIKQEVTKEFMEKMSAGVYLKDLGVKTLPCRIDPGAESADSQDVPGAVRKCIFSEENPGVEYYSGWAETGRVPGDYREREG